MILLANLDLIALAVALPVFIVAGLTMAGYLVAAGVWLLSRLIQSFAERKAYEDLASGKRNTAMGTVAATSLGRVWVIAIAVLITGLVARDAGLSAAVLLVVLFTLNMASRGLVHLVTSDQTA